jgi:hypothetical protein
MKRGPHAVGFTPDTCGEGEFRRIGFPGRATPGGLNPPGGLTGGSYSPGGYTGGLASNSNILANSNLYSKRLQGMNKRVGRRVLMQETACKKSRVCVLLNGYSFEFALT